MRTMNRILVTCVGLLGVTAAAPRPVVSRDKPSNLATKLEQCFPLGVETPVSCAEHWPRHEEPRVVLTGLIKDTVPADLVRQIEYHLLLGVDVAIIFDNLDICNT